VNRWFRFRQFLRDKNGNVMLPKSAQEIIEIIGITDAEKLIKQHGGTTLFITNGTMMRLDISGAACTELLAVFKGNYLYIPRCYKLLMDRRNLQIKADRMDGYKIPELCRKYNLTDRRIFAICAEVAIEYNQVDLFST
jgi:hypothetical protein